MRSIFTKCLHACILLLLLLLSLNSSAVTTTPAQNANTNIQLAQLQMLTQPKPAPSRLWNLRDADLRSVIAAVSHETGKNFVIDPRVTGKVSIISSTPINARELYQVFLSVLQVAGYSAIPTGNIIKIVPDIDSKTMPAPLANSLAPGQGDANVVRIIAVRNVSAVQLVPILRPLLPQWSEISAYAPSNMIIVSGRAANLERIANIISRVDTRDANGIDMIPLQFATADDLVKTLKSLDGNQQTPTGVNVNVAADTRSNSILLSGSKSLRLRYRVIISELDTPSPAGASADTQVIYLQYLEAKDIVPILAGVARSEFSGDVGTVIGTKTVVRLPQTMQTVTGLGDNPIATPSINPNDNQTANSTTSEANKNSNQPRVEIIAEPNTNSVILNAPPQVMRTLKAVIARLDVRPAQVMIEAIIAEIDQDDVNDLGIEWGSIAADRNDSNEEVVGFKSGFGVISKNGFRNFQLQINALANSNKANILSTPTVVVLDNHLAHIKVGKQFSVQTSEYPNNAGGSSGATPFTTFDREDAALLLNVTPQISQSGNIRLTILHQNNQAQNPNDKTGRPIFDISEITTSVIIHNRDTLVLGGLMQNQVSQGDVKIPIIGDIPVLGQIFHHHSNSYDKKKLLIFLHPVILADNNSNLHVTNAKYDDMREDQLKLLRQMRYDPETQVVLPDRHPPIVLPKPFSPTTTPWQPQNYSK